LEVKLQRQGQRQKQRRNAGVLRSAQNDKQKEMQRQQQCGWAGGGLHPTHRKCAMDGAPILLVLSDGRTITTADPFWRKQTVSEMAANGEGDGKCFF
jgi:hypothetical protein